MTAFGRKRTFKVRHLRSLQHPQPDRENAARRKFARKYLQSAAYPLERQAQAPRMTRKRLNLRVILRRREKRRQSSGLYGGERGIRTPGTASRTTDFESAPFD